MEHLVRLAEAELSRGHPLEALARLRPALRYPQDYDSNGFVEVVRVFREIVRREAPSLEGPIAAVLASPDHVERLYDAARALHEHEIHDVAALFLGRANRLMPGRVTLVSELCATLGADLRHPEALTVLAQSGLVPRDPFCLYLTAHHRLMSGDRDGAARTRAEVRDEGDAMLTEALRRLDGLLARAAAVAAATSLDRVDLTGWHAALDGSLLLHEVRGGIGMNGRAGDLADSLGLVRAGVEAMARLVISTGRPVAHVCPATDRSSQILGLALAERLDRPVLRYREQLRDSIIVVYDLREVDPGMRSALHRHDGNVLWVHAASWSRPGPISPDVATVLCQRVTPPWALDQRPQELVVRDVASAVPASGRRDGGLPTALVEATRDLTDADALGFVRAAGRRRTPLRGSPVPSERVAPDARAGLRTWV